MRSAVTLATQTRPDNVCSGHEGRYRVLVKLGADAWSYYLLTRRQLRFWRKLTGYERNLIARREAKGCFLCALDAAALEMERFEEGLYAALMTSLLVQS